MNVKNFFKLQTILLVTLVGVNFTSCDDKSGGGGGKFSLIGTWYMDTSTGQFRDRDIYEFLNENTCKNYWITGDPKTGYFEESNHPVPYPKGNGWYYWPNDGQRVSNIKTYTYTKADNKIYITNGVILTISDNTLIKDGSSGVYRKWE